MEHDAAVILKVERASLRYRDGEPVLCDVDLSLVAGSFQLLVGPSGSGKSSLLRLLSLSHPPASGSLTLFGRDVARLGREELGLLRRRIGVVFQDLRLLDHLSVFDNVALPLRIGGAEENAIAAHVTKLLAWLGLDDQMEVMPPTLSMGQRQVVAVARAVITRPEHGIRLLIAADDIFRHAVVYTPPGKPYFAVEPASNMTDAVNRMDSVPDHGLRGLAPGDTLSREVRFMVEDLPEAP